MMTFEEIQGLLARNKSQLEELRLALRLEADSREIDRLTQETLETDFWTDPQRAQTVQKRIAQLNKKNKRFTDLVCENDDFQVLLDLSQEEEDPSVLAEVQEGLDQWKEAYEGLRLETLLTGEHDAMDALLSLHAGAEIGRASCRERV